MAVAAEAGAALAALMDNIELGRYGERLAERFLRERGLTIIDRNWRCEVGEIDLVARDGGCLVLCEVKTRSHNGFGAPVEAVTWSKALRLRRLAAAYLREAGERFEDVRIDVVGVLRPASGPAVVRHIRAVGA